MTGSPVRPHNVSGKIQGKNELFKKLKIKILTFVFNVQKKLFLSVEEQECLRCKRREKGEMTANFSFRQRVT